MIAQRRQLRAEDLKDAGTGARTINELLLDIYRKLETIGGDVADVYVTINNLTPTSLALAAAGSVPNANAASLSYVYPLYTLALQPTDGVSPGIISGTNQTLSTGATIITFAGQVNHSNIIRLSSSNSVQFNGGSTHYVRYASNITAGLQFGGDNFEFQPTATTSVLYYSQKINADRYGIIAKDDQSGTPGNFTTTRSAGRAAFTATGAATDTVIVITNNTAGKAFAATDDAYVTFIDLDATATTMKAVCTANTLTVTANAAATATCRFSWWVLK